MKEVEREQPLWMVWLVSFLLLAACVTVYGVYHEVKPGENFYRIAKTYEVDPEELAEINEIKEPSHLRAGERIFIPGATRVLPVEVPVAAKGDRAPPRRAQRVEKKATPAPEERHPTKKKPFYGQFIWPLDRGTVTSRYGERNGDMHDGVDIAAKKGTPIRAAAAGRVIYADRRLKGYGNMIIIKHEGVYSTVYAHNDVNLVKKNEFVERGQVIGRVGQTGRASAPHLHFEVRKGRRSVNPLLYLPQNG